MGGNALTQLCQLVKLRGKQFVGVVMCEVFTTVSYPVEMLVEYIELCCI